MGSIATNWKRLAFTTACAVAMLVAGAAPADAKGKSLDYKKVRKAVPEMSRLAALPRATWTNLESGAANPTIAVLTKVALALQVSVEELLSEHTCVWVTHSPEQAERVAQRTLQLKGAPHAD